MVINFVLFFFSVWNVVSFGLSIFVGERYCWGIFIGGGFQIRVDGFFFWLLEGNGGEVGSGIENGCGVLVFIRFIIGCLRLFWGYQKVQLEFKVERFVIKCYQFFIRELKKIYKVGRVRQVGLLLGFIVYGLGRGKEFIVLFFILGYFVIKSIVLNVKFIGQVRRWE